MSRIDLAYTLHTRGELQAAEDVYRAMILEGEEPVSAANNLFALLHAQDRLGELASLYRSIESLIPLHGDWALRLAHFLLARGQYAPGWVWYEARRHATRDRVAAPALSMPEWDGGAVKRLLIWREQGLGDCIQFARYIAELARREIEVTLLCSPSLARLFAGLPAQVTPLAGEVRVSGDYDAWCLLGSLPRLTGGTFEIPPPVAVNAAPRRSGGVGVMPAGSPQHVNDAHRSLPAELAARLLTAPGAISLRPEDTGARDLQDTAEIIAGLDLVVTVDTSVAHLAGSMGKPVWVLLPHKGVDWRWLRERSDSPWYPSARLIRQGEGGWEPVVAQVLAALP